MESFLAKRSFALWIGLAALFFLPGCPVYPDDSYSQGQRCIYATDCPIGYRCTSGYCVLAPPFGGAVGAADAGAAGDAAVDSGGEDATVSDVGADVGTETLADRGDAAPAPD